MTELSQQQPSTRQWQRNWEALFFVAIDALMSAQVLFFQVNIHHLKHLPQLVAAVANLNAFVFKTYGPLFSLVAISLLIVAARRGPDCHWSRRVYDGLGGYFMIRITTQLIGLNILVFDLTSSRFLLISQLIFFLPTLLLMWGWVYWRLDQMARSTGRALFHLDHEAEHPRVIDYVVASFSTVFSASINGIKGASARARMLILLHGFMIYDVMGLTLSRAVALVQG